MRPADQLSARLAFGFGQTVRDRDLSPDGSAVRHLAHLEPVKPRRATDGRLIATQESANETCSGGRVFRSIAQNMCSAAGFEVSIAEQRANARRPVRDVCNASGGHHVGVLVTRTRVIPPTATPPVCAGSSATGAVPIAEPGRHRASRSNSTVASGSFLPKRLNIGAGAVGRRPGVSLQPAGSLLRRAVVEQYVDQTPVVDRRQAVGLTSSSVYCFNRSVIAGMYRWALCSQVAKVAPARRRK